MKRWIHAATNRPYKIELLPSTYTIVKSLNELGRGDTVAIPNAVGSGYYILTVKDNDRAEDSAGRGYNLIEQSAYNRVVAERNGNKVAVYKE